MTEFFVIDIASVKNITIDLIGQSNKKGTLLLWIHLIFNWQVPFTIYIYIYIYRPVDNIFYDRVFWYRYSNCQKHNVFPWPLHAVAIFKNLCYVIFHFFWEYIYFSYIIFLDKKKVLLWEVSYPISYVGL